jgi:hypothetical protein
VALCTAAVLAPVAAGRTITAGGKVANRGDTTFFQILGAITSRYRYGSITSAEFEQVAQEVSGRDLHQFFADYLYGTVRPPLPSTYV